MNTDIQKEKIMLEDLYPTIKSVLESNGTFLLYPNGTSMLPTIRPGKDAVLLSRADHIRKNDMILYKRKNGAFVLHRIVRILDDGSFVLRGDNQYFDKNGITREQVVAKVGVYYRGKREVHCDSFRHRAYLLRRRVGYPFRRFFFRLKGKLCRTFGKKVR